MTITREQVADLREGDVVELSCDNWPDGTIIRGPVSPGKLLGCIELATRDWGSKAHLTVVSRAPRPLYVNHDRTEPEPGDVVREEVAEDYQTLWMFDSFGTWHSKDSTCRPEHMEGPLRLLVDGTTGQVVP